MYIRKYFYIHVAISLYFHFTAFSLNIDNYYQKYYLKNYSKSSLHISTSNVWILPHQIMI